MVVKGLLLRTSKLVKAGEYYNYNINIKQDQADRYIKPPGASPQQIESLAHRTKPLSTLSPLPCVCVCVSVCLRQEMSDREGHSGIPPGDDDLSLPKATVAKMITGSSLGSPTPSPALKKSARTLTAGPLSAYITQNSSLMM
jgi:hypothetical protein